MPTRWNNELGATSSERFLLTTTHTKLLTGERVDVLAKLRIVNISGGGGGR